MQPFEFRIQDGSEATLTILAVVTHSTLWYNAQLVRPHDFFSSGLRFFISVHFFANKNWIYRPKYNTWYNR